MAKILFHMFPEPGHVGPTIKLAKGLAARGHAVAYHAILDFEDQIRGEGLGFVPYLPDQFPRGHVSSVELPRLMLRRKIAREYRAELRGVRPGGPVERALLEHAADLVIVDAMQVAYGLLVRRLGLPLLLFTTSLPQTKDRGVPPLGSAVAYDPSLRGRVEAELAWVRTLAKKRLIDAATSVVGLPTRAARVRAAAPRYDAGALDGWTAFLPQIAGVAEIVACPPALDFPRPPRPSRVYTESVDLARRESGEVPEVGEGPLVFCSMGTQAHRTKGGADFLRRVVQAFAQLPEVHGLIATGGADLGAPPPNVTIVPRAPQLAVLRRAALMITHGGLGSFKECVAHGVPMNVYPLKDDQPGNGARVEHHRLGHAGRTHEASATQIAELMRRTLREGAPGMKAMQGEVLRFEAAGHGVAAVERMLAAR